MTRYQRPVTPDTTDDGFPALARHKGSTRGAGPVVTAV